jgi:alpha-galactosidase
MAGFVEIASVDVDPALARVYEHGWQSWSPTASYALTERPRRPSSDKYRLLCYRADREAPADAFQGEGLLALDPGDGGRVRLWSAADPRRAVASIRATVRGRQVVVEADGPVTEAAYPLTLEEALARWATAYAGELNVRPAPTVWCSWYHYFTKVTEADMDENLAAMDALELPIDVVQLDDGYQAELGDWLTLSGRFASVEGLVDRIRARGRRAGIWVAPFLVGERSRLAAEHPDWLLRRPDGDGLVHAGNNWDQDLYALDATHPDAAAYLTEVFGTFRSWGIDYFKIDFIFAGALAGTRHADVPPLAAYADAVKLIRAAIGDDSYLLGCGAPILPSVGLVDAMRISPDTAPAYDLMEGDWALPSSRAAMLTGANRQWQHGRFWVNDPDCLIVRPEVERREEWAAHVERVGGLVGSSDRLNDLDEWGLETTRRLLAAAR